jgi:hypothetical protein
MAGWDDSPIEWVPGTWFGVAWLATYIAYLLIYLGVFVFGLAFPGNTTTGPNAVAQYLPLVLLPVLLVQMYVLFRVPINRRIGLTPAYLLVQYPHRREIHLWYQLYRPSNRVVTANPYWSHLPMRLVPTRRQAERLSSFWSNFSR